jgi:uncharacterized protein (DUF169 family)
VSKLEEETKKIVRILGLRWPPIAAKFSAKPAEGADSAKKLSMCEAINVVRREKLVLNLSKENCTCSGGRHFTGLESLPLETIAGVLTKKGHRVYESMDVAFASIVKQPQPVNRGDFFVLGPLEKFDADPDMVILFANPAQAEKILGLVSFKGAEPSMYYPASSICSTITNVMAKGRPEVNLVSAFERRGGKWSPDELIVALPLKDFEAAVGNILQSEYGVAEHS